jgi:hypothetical protein
MRFFFATVGSPVCPAPVRRASFDCLYSQCGMRHRHRQPTWKIFFARGAELFEVIFALVKSTAGHR